MTKYINFWNTSVHRMSCDEEQPIRAGVNNNKTHLSSFSLELPYHAMAARRFWLLSNGKLNNPPPTPKLCWWMDESGTAGIFMCFRCYIQLAADFFFVTLCVCVQVSKKALHLLAQVEQEPLLNLEQLNPDLVTHVESMAQAHNLRKRLRLLGDYLLTCRSGACKKLQARCVSVFAWCNLYFTLFYCENLITIYFILSEWSSERTCWSRVICTVSWTYDRYPAAFNVSMHLSSATWETSYMTSYVLFSFLDSRRSIRNLPDHAAASRLQPRVPLRPVHSAGLHLSDMPR